MRVAVIGGGLQGAGIALELSLRGASIDLFEKSDACLNRASLQNEGKIHLGFIYAKDSALSTARLMIEGGLQFEPIIERWLDARLPAGLASSPFYYLVHRDSLMESDALGAYYRAVSSLIREAAAEPGRSYFGFDASASIRRLCPNEQAGMVDSELVTAIFHTPERAIDPQPIADLLRARIHEEKRINICEKTSVIRVGVEPDEVTVTAEGPAGIIKRRYDHVVNASWESRLAIDATAGIPPIGEWSFRVKHFLRIRAAPPSLNPPSATIVLGGFGDAVQYGTGDLFLSWYPVGRRGWSSELTPPLWPLPLGEPARSEVRTGIYQGLCRIMPWLSHLSADAVDGSEVNGGIIYALGATDVNDPGSQLHQRARVGPRSYGRYHSVDTGKYSLAPLFAKIVAGRIMGETS